MNATLLIEQQLASLNATFHLLVDDLTAQEWLARPIPHYPQVAYIIWHLPRVQDTIVQTWIRGAPEVAHGERWARWHSLRRLGSGIGVTLAEADEIARHVHRADVLEYADAVNREVQTWLKSLSDDDLERIPDARAHLAPYPEYQTRHFREETDHLRNQPIWKLLWEPYAGYFREHLGEIRLMKSILRQVDDVVI